MGVICCGVVTAVWLDPGSVVLMVLLTACCVVYGRTKNILEGASADISKALYNLTYPYYLEAVFVIRRIQAQADQFLCSE